MFTNDKAASRHKEIFDLQCNWSLFVLDSVAPPIPLEIIDVKLSCHGKWLQAPMHTYTQN